MDGFSILRWRCPLPHRAHLCEVEWVPKKILVFRGDVPPRELIQGGTEPVAVRSLAEACAGAGAPSVRAESHARLAFRARVPSFAGAEECKELLRMPFPPSSTRPGRSSCRWPRKVRVEPHAPRAQRAPHSSRSPLPCALWRACPAPRIECDSLSRQGSSSSPAAPARVGQSHDKVDC